MRVEESINGVHDTDYQDLQAILEKDLESNPITSDDLDKLSTMSLQNNGIESNSELYSQIFNSNSYPTSKSSSLKNRTFLAEVLSGMSTADKEIVLHLVLNADIKGDDPLFVVLLAMGKIELLLHKKPVEIGALFDRLFLEYKTDWEKKLRYSEAYMTQQSKILQNHIQGTKEAMEATSRAALDTHADSITAAVNTLIKQAAFQKVAHDAAALTKAGLYIFISMIVGGIVAVTIPRFFGFGNDVQGVQLSNKDIAALEWAKSEVGQKARNNPSATQWAVSEEGLFARKFFVWNNLLMSKQGKTRICEQDAKKFGLTLTLEDRAVNNGFCTLWVTPPEDRKYVPN